MLENMQLSRYVEKVRETHRDNIYDNIYDNRSFSFQRPTSRITSWKTLTSEGSFLLLSVEQVARRSALQVDITIPLFDPSMSSGERISLQCLQEWSLWAESLGPGCSTWAWRQGIRWLWWHPTVRRCTKHLIQQPQLVTPKNLIPLKILEDNFQYGPVLYGSLGVAVTVVPISPLFTAPEIARVKFYKR